MGLSPILWPIPDYLGRGIKVLVGVIIFLIGGRENTLVGVGEMTRMNGGALQAERAMSL